jgi:hypothetical protein
MKLQKTRLHPKDKIKKACSGERSRLPNEKSPVETGDLR